MRASLLLLLRKRLDSMVISPDAYKRAEDLFSVRYFESADRSGQQNTLENFYALDYRASRVNFNLHQKRAHELAALIHRNHEAEKDTLRIAVCGGGIGGLTCFIALHAFGFVGTQLYEGGQQLLGLQLDCSHRHSHPSYNDWPEALRHRATTDLPFMNWSAGTAHNIAGEMLCDELVDGVTRENENLIHREFPITQLARVQRDGSLVWEINPGRKPVLADVVVYALGFGRERCLDASRADSYWWDDNLENYQRELYRFDRHKFIVCGLGDGGLIDAIRIGFGPRRSEMVGPALIAAGRHDTYQNPPREPDFEDGEDTRSQWETKIEEACKRSRVDGDSLLSELKHMLKAAAEGDDVLSSKLKTLKVQQSSPRGNDVFLIGMDAFNVSRNMSPINVLLFALLEGELDEATPSSKNSTRYLQGKFNQEESKIELDGPDATEFDSGFSMDKNLVFLRIGPENGIHNIVTLLKGKTLADRPDEYNHLTTADQIDASNRYDIMKALGFLRDGDEELDSETIEWDYRTSCVQRFAKSVFGEQAQVSLQRCEENGYWVQINAPVADATGEWDDLAQKNREAVLELGGFDRRLFGAPIAFRTPVPNKPQFSATARRMAPEANDE